MAIPGQNHVYVCVRTHVYVYSVLRVVGQRSTLDFIVGESGILLFWGSGQCYADRLSVLPSDPSVRPSLLPIRPSVRPILPFVGLGPVGPWSPYGPVKTQEINHNIKQCVTHFKTNPK